MKKIFALIFLSLSISSFAELCPIYIHGYTAKTNGYFGNEARQVIWNSSKSIADSAMNVAEGILKAASTCQESDLLLLKPHSYGAAQVFFILAQGKRFEAHMPQHPFVQIYKRTAMVYSFTGAYHGTPLMDIICSSGITKALGSLVGKPCVPSLTTSSQLDVSSFVTSPGVPTYLIYSTNRGGYAGIPGFIISKYGNSFYSFVFKGRRTQNDNTLPIHSTMACAENAPIRNANSTCSKIDGNFFIDAHHTTSYYHNEFLTLSSFLNQDYSKKK